MFDRVGDEARFTSGTQVERIDMKWGTSWPIRSLYRLSRCSRQLFGPNRRAELPGRIQVVTAAG